MKKEKDSGIFYCVAKKRGGVGRFGSCGAVCEQPTVTGCLCNSCYAEKKKRSD